MKRIEFYKTPTGRCPVEQFLDGISDMEAAKVVWVLKLIREMDRMPTRYFKKMAGSKEIWEVRVDSGSSTFRLLGFFFESELVILTSGFQKKARRTPRNAIRLAENRRREFMNRRRNDG